MAIWVSRYSNKELQSGNYYPVGISIGKPRWPLGYEVREQCYSLAPKGYMLNMDQEKFRAAYYEKLKQIGNDKIVSIVQRLEEKAYCEGKELVLLCYEDVRVEGEWCHRTIFAEWWLEQTGEVVEELKDPSEPKVKRKALEKKSVISEPKEDDRQISIFDVLGEG